MNPNLIICQIKEKLLPSAPPEVVSHTLALFDRLMSTLPEFTNLNMLANVAVYISYSLFSWYNFPKFNNFPFIFPLTDENELYSNLKIVTEIFGTNFLCSIPEAPHIKQLPVFRKEPETKKGFRVINKLGEGGFADVYEWENKAIKIYKKIDFDSVVIREITLLSYMNHPNIIKLESFHYQKYAILVMKKYERTLISFTCSKSFKEHKEEYRWMIVKQLVSALRYLHSEKIYHGDIAPKNILVTESEKSEISPAFKFPTVMLIDFQMSGFLLKDEVSYVGGTFNYRAPELLHKKATLAADIWALGWSLFYLWKRSQPDDFLAEIYPEIYDKYDDLGGSEKSGDSEEAEGIESSGETPWGVFGTFIQDLDELMKDKKFIEGDIKAEQLIRMMLKTSPKERATAEQIYKFVN